MLLYSIVCVNLTVWAANAVAITACVRKKSWLGLAVAALFTALNAHLMFVWSLEIISNPVLVDWPMFALAWFVSCLSPLYLTYLAAKDMV